VIKFGFGVNNKLNHSAFGGFLKGIITMARCDVCGKTTTFGHNRSFSQRATNRVFRPNLQRVTVMVGGRRVRRVLCARCIRTMVKSK
jgi:large subunit ribosomal protein L28